MPALRLIVLDRDGVINRDSVDFIRSPDQWVPLPGSLEAIAGLHRLGFHVVVATNQSAIGRGLIDAHMLEQIHASMLQRVEQADGRIAGIFVCPHHPDAGCRCRKPRPGLLRQIADRYSISPDKMTVVGDSPRDLQAALAFGAQPVLVRTGNGLDTERSAARLGHPAVYNDLLDFHNAMKLTVSNSSS